MVVKIMAPLGSAEHYVLNYTKDPKREHNFDNHPYDFEVYLRYGYT